MCEPPASAPDEGDSSSYMSEAMRMLADMRLVTKDGVALPAHASMLVLRCETLARSAELLMRATYTHPITLASPFNGYGSTDVARFLRCMYAFAPHANDICSIEVVRLAHALEATSLLDFALCEMTSRVRPGLDLRSLCHMASLAEFCHWDELRAKCVTFAVDIMHNPIAPYEHELLTDLAVMSYAECIAIYSPSELFATDVFRGANFELPNSGDYIAPGLTSFKVENDFIATLSIDSHVTGRHWIRSGGFERKGMNFMLGLAPNGFSRHECSRRREGVNYDDDRPHIIINLYAMSTTLELTWKSVKISFTIGLYNFKTNEVLVRRLAVITRRPFDLEVCLPGLTQSIFRDPSAGYVVNDMVALYVCNVDIEPAD